MKKSRRISAKCLLNYDGKRTVSVRISLKSADWKRLVALAKKRKISLSRLINEILAKELCDCHGCR